MFWDVFFFSPPGVSSIFNGFFFGTPSPTLFVAERVPPHLSIFFPPCPTFFFWGILSGLVFFLSERSPAYFPPTAVGAPPRSFVGRLVTGNSFPPIRARLVSSNSGCASSDQFFLLFPV